MNILKLLKSSPSAALAGFERSLNENAFLIQVASVKTANCEWRLTSAISIILKLYSPRYPVKMTFQGPAAQLRHIFRVLFITF